MNQKFKKVTCFFAAALAAFTLCLHPVKQPEKPYEPGIGVCNVGDDDPVELPLDPDPPNPY